MSRWEGCGFDSVCLAHGKRQSEHEYNQCLYCALCFKQLTLEECNVLADGRREDVCVPCAKEELRHGNQSA